MERSFYPDKLPQTKWFKHYCEHFDTLELNVTFYRFPRLHTLQKWYADPSLPPDVIQTTELLYYRFHGNEQLYASKYEDTTLQAFAATLNNLDFKKAFIYFNNDINTHAVSNAMELKTMLSII